MRENEQNKWISIVIVRTNPIKTNGFYTSSAVKDVETRGNNC